MGPTIEQQRDKIRKKKKLRKDTRLRVGDFFFKGTYFLYSGNRIVYIGKATSNVMQRIYTHFKDKSKIFDSFRIYKQNVSDKELTKIEQNLIRKYNPKYNVQHKSNKAKIVYGANTK